MDAVDSLRLPSVVLADDISGAAEAAVMFGTGTRVAMGLPSDGSLSATGVRVTVIDTDTRASRADQAEQAIAAALEALDPALPLVKKIDSLLRGNVQAELAPLLRTGRLVILVPALPELGRTTVAGVITIEGVPLHDTDLWLAEPVPAPHSVAQVLGRLPHRLLGLDEVRGDALPAKLREMRGSVVICDAENHDDLDAIACAALQVRSIALVGSSALCKVVSGGRQPVQIKPGASNEQPCLTVVGTASPAAREQARLLADNSVVTRIELGVTDLLDGNDADRDAAADRLNTALSAGDVLVTLEAIAGDGPRPSGRALTEALADIVSRTFVRTGTGPAVDLILTGGETARAVLDALGVSHLDVLGQTEAGAVVSSTPNGARVGTRPGSFGGPDSLLTLRRSLRNEPKPDFIDHLQTRDNPTEEE